MYKSLVTKQSQTNKLRTKTCFQYACAYAGIAYNGNQLEKHFNDQHNQTARSGKFTKLLHYCSIPSPETISRMDNEIEGFKSIFNGPLWDALYCIEANRSDVTELLAQQDLDVVNCIFEAKRDESGNLVRRELYLSDVKKVLKISSLSALAALILIRLGFNDPHNHLRKTHLENYIAALMINLCADKTIPCMHWEIYSAVNNSLITSKKCKLSRNAFELEVKNTRELLRFINKFFVRHNDKSPKVLSFVTLGNKQLIFSEFRKVRDGMDLQLCESKDANGLLWLLNKMYSLVPRNDLIWKVKSH